MPLPTPYNVRRDAKHPGGFAFQIDIGGKTYGVRITGERAGALPGGQHDPQRAIEINSNLAHEVLKLFRDDPNEPIFIE